MSRFIPFVLAVTILTNCSKPAGPSSAQVDPGLAIMIPPDTIALAYLNADALRKTTLYQRQLAKREYPQLEQFARSTGIDPRKDLWQLLFVSDGKHNVLFGRGYFKDDMESYLQRDGAQVIPYKMYHMVGSEQAAVVFFNSTTAAVGDTASLKSMIDARTQSKGPPPAIAERMKAIPADAQIWAVYTGGAIKLPFELKGNMANANRVLQGVQTASLYLDMRDGVKGSVNLLTVDDEEGKKLNEVLRGLIGFGRLSASKEYLRAFDGLEVSQEGKQVNLKVVEPQDLVEKFLAP